MEIDYVAAYEEFGSFKKAADAFGLPKTTFQDRYNRQKKQETFKNLGIKSIEEYSSQTLKGTSTLVDAEGNVRLRWIKTDAEKEQQESNYQKLLDRLSDDIQKVEPRRFTNIPHSNLCSVYVISDFHLGQLSSADEVGEEWTLEKAHDVLKDWIYKASHAAPFAKQAILVDLGDFLQADGLMPVTPTSGHVVDVDARFRDVVDVAISVFIHAIDRLLEKHENVHVIIAEGNHNIDSSYWQTKALSLRYENEPRVTFDFSKLPYYAYQWGKTGLYFHHGHKKKMSEVAKTFVAYFRDIYGSTKYSYGHLGHFHHREMKECPLMVMEQHSTLAPKDAYSARGGYHSERGAVVISYHKEHGEVSRSCIRPEMLL